jgi:hypothetical protein
LILLGAERMLILSPTLAVEPRVPVTARLSKGFYDVLGEDIANELVDWFNAVGLTPRFARGGLYRTDLRELNELNYARFDAKLEQRVAELKAQMDSLGSKLDSKLDARLSSLRAELLGWMFGMWITLLGVMLALSGRLW